MSAKYKLLAVCMIPFFLSGCGDGYELIQTDEMFPYGNARTAGSGPAYVLAKMMPEKELVLDMKPVERVREPQAMVIEEPPAVAHTPPVQEPTPADTLFLESGKK
ncbi:MAG: hypothetical protein ACPGRX_01645 [Bdellovibrionales bacterium]